MMDLPDFEFNFGAAPEEPKQPEPKPAPEGPKPVTPPEDLTEEQINELLADLEADLENEDSVLAEMAKVIEAEAEVVKTEAATSARKAEINKLAAEKAEVQKLLDSINQRLAKARSDAWEVYTQEKAARRKVTEAKQKAEVAKQAVIAKRKFERQGELFDRLAKGKAWHEGIVNGDGKTIRILPHQWTGARYLASAERAILGDGMGLGKTLTAIAALDLVRSDRALVVCPADVASNFVAEVKMWAPHRPVLSLKGESRRDRNTILDALAFMEKYVLVINYEAWRRDHNLIKRFQECRFDTVILDESHNVKTTSSDAYLGVKDIILDDNLCVHCEDGGKMVSTPGNSRRSCKTCGWDSSLHTTLTDEDGNELSDAERFLLSKSVRYVWPMTGTPILNAPQDIFAPLSLIDPRTFYNQNSFLRNYCRLNQYTGRWEFLPGGLERLKHNLSGRFLARSLSDTDIVLPPQHPTIHEVALDPERYELQMRTIKQLTKYSAIMLNSGKQLPIFAQIALITRQRQASVWPGGIKVIDPETKAVLFAVSEDVRESIKIDKAVELIIEAVDKGERVALFSQFATALEELQSRINGMVTNSGNRISSIRFDGSTPDGTKDAIKANFNKSRGEEKKWDVVLANYKTGGVGLNLTACTHTIILDEEWNPGKRDQSYARTRRLGQDETTFVHVIRIPRTIDTWMADLIEEKESMIAGFEGSMIDVQERLRKAIEEGIIDGGE